MFIIILENSNPNFNNEKCYILILIHNKDEIKFSILFLHYGFFSIYIIKINTVIYDSYTFNEFLYKLSGS